MIAREIMFDLFGVGWTKPLGYLPLSTIEFHGWTPELVTRWSLHNGLSSQELSEGNARTLSGALYVWDPRALQALLDANRDILSRHAWPTDAFDFVQRVVRDTVHKDAAPHLYALIGRAFADERFKDADYISSAHFPPQAASESGNVQGGSDAL